MQPSSVGYIRKFESLGGVDGPGVRTIAFLSGCPLRCLFCHNPDMWDKTKGDAISVEAFMKKIERYIPYYGEKGGVTFCGGEPLSQPQFLFDAMTACKEVGIHTTLDTSGYGNPKMFEKILSVTDLVLYDIKGIEPLGYQKMTGAPIRTTEKFLEVAQSMAVPLWIRIVIVPGIHDSFEHMDKMADYIAGIDHIERIELLPYHTMGVNKYKDLGLTYPLDGVEAMNGETAKALENYLIEQVSKRRAI